MYGDRRVSGGGGQEIEKQKKEAFQISGPPPYEFLDTPLEDHT